MFSLFSPLEGSFSLSPSLSFTFSFSFLFSLIFLIFLIFLYRIDTVVSILFVFQELFLHNVPQHVGDACSARKPNVLLKRECAGWLLQLPTVT